MGPSRAHGPSAGPAEANSLPEVHGPLKSMGPGVIVPSPLSVALAGANIPFVARGSRLQLHSPGFNTGFVDNVFKLYTVQVDNRRDFNNGCKVKIAIRTLQKQQISRLVKF